MTGVGIAAILFSLIAVPSVRGRGSHVTTLPLLCLLVLHIGASVAYYLYVQANPADTALYYYDLSGLANRPFKTGTRFTIQLVQWMKSNFGGSYFDYFLVFQSIGFWGIAILWRTLHEMHVEARIPETRMSRYVLFAPGISFWTSAIGKDAPLFFAVSLAVWSSMKLAVRAPYFAIAIVIMILFRPHIGFICIASLALATLLHSRSSPLTRLGLLIVTTAGAVLAAGTVRSAFDVSVTSATSIAEFLEAQQIRAGNVEGGTYVQGNIIVKTFSLLFRPLFFDAKNIFGAISSIENIGVIFAVGFLMMRYKSGKVLVRHVLYMRFCLVFSIALVVALAATYYNVGLGLRQRTMIVPSFLVLFLGVWALHHERLRRATMLGLAGGSHSAAPDLPHADALRTSSR